ncbi:MAG: cytochrome c biogenesis protein CcsA, partial [Coriobacteriia bacterium]
MTSEIILMWLAVSLYALSAVLFIVSLIFKRPGLTRLALGVAMLGLLPHTVAIGMRWVRVDHGPYLGFYEVVSSFAWISVLTLGLLAWRRPTLGALGVILMPIAFLLLGGSMFAPQAELAITGTLASWWLTIHVAFAKLSYGAFIASFALALVYLYRERADGVLADALSKLPDQEVLDDLQFRFVSVGFVFLGIMIVAGAIWANEA